MINVSTPAPAQSDLDFMHPTNTKRGNRTGAGKSAALRLSGKLPEYWFASVYPISSEEQPVQKKPAPAKKLPPTTAFPPVLVSQTYRLPADLVKQLIKVAVSRKLDRTAPWSQQDIVAEAIRDWLEQHANKQASM